MLPDDEDDGSSPRPKSIMESMMPDCDESSCPDIADDLKKPLKSRVSRRRSSFAVPPNEDALPDCSRSMLEQALENPRVFNVGLLRSVRKVKLALDTKDNDSKLRRYKQVFNDKTINHNERFCDDLAAMEEEFKRLKFRSERAEQARLDRLAEEERKKVAGTEAERYFLQEVADKKRQAAEKKRLELLAAEQRQKEALERAQVKRRRIFKMKMASHMLGAEAEVGEDEVDENGEVDLRKSRVWNPHYMWCCDIVEREGEKSNDFLFLADLSQQTGGARSKTSKRSGRCIFDSVMYDLQKFDPEYREDGNIVFELRFGVKTKERPKVPMGWAIDFEVKQNETGGYEGTCHTSWWGLREVVIMPYMSMTPEELSNFPDPVAKYFKSPPT